MPFDVGHSSSSSTLNNMNTQFSLIKDMEDISMYHF